MSEVQVNNNNVRKRKSIQELYQKIKDIEAGTIVLDDNDEPEEPAYPSGRPKRSKRIIKKE